MAAGMWKLFGLEVRGATTAGTARKYSTKVGSGKMLLRRVFFLSLPFYPTSQRQNFCPGGGI